MANKRQLKKQIKYICGDLAAECIIARECINGIDANAMNEIIYQIAELQTAAIMRVTFGFDKAIADFENKHQHNIARNKYFKSAYKKLTADFWLSVQNIVAAMNKELPAGRKEANKAALA